MDLFFWQRVREEGSNSKSRLKKTRVNKSDSSAGKSLPLNNDDIHDSDEYDSGDEVVKTKEDEDFLDVEEDDQELLRDYERDNDKFDDERPQDSRGGPVPGRSVGSAKRVSGGGGIGMIDPNTSNPFEQTLLGLKRQKAVEISDQKKSEIATQILQAMNKAAEDDKLLYQQGKPAVNKLQMISKMEKAATTKALQAALLNFDLLIVLNSWIEPMSKSVLAGLTLRTAVYGVLHKLPCEMDQLRRSNIGKTLVMMLKHKKETPENKRKIREIIDKWSRPIFGKSTDARHIDIRERLMHETPAERQHRAAMVEKSTANIIKEKSSSKFELSANEKVEVDDGRSRARLPTNHGLMFTVQPQSRIGGDSLGGGKATAKPAKDSSRSGIIKRLKDMKQSSGKKDFRLVTADVGGRDKA